jgi:hypothetical protein
MKKLVLILLLLIPIGLSAQFLKPVPHDLFTVEPTTDRTFRGSSIWLLRPAITVTAIQWNWDKELKQFEASAFQSAGLGVGWQHFIPTSATDPTPFNNYGANALLLLGTDISGAITFSGLGILNIGLLYNFTQKTPGILTGVQIKF